MSQIAVWRARLFGLSSGFSNPVSTNLFVRIITLYVLVKVLLQWRVHVLVLDVHTLRLPAGPLSGTLLFPAGFANNHSNIFFLAVVVFLSVHLFLRSNYLTSLVFCWLMFNLFVINIPIGDGGDLVAFMLSVWAVFLVPRTISASPYAVVMQVTLHNAARLCCMLQFVFLYAASGIDKLKSGLWTTGSAFAYIGKLEGLVNPSFADLLANPYANAAMAWITIGLELTFGILVWFRKWQPAMILSAILFHLGIWWMLDLPHFAVTMIVSVLIFIRDDQYHRIFRPWLLSR